jgi:type IX secretion system PorP/SprF family membrane protein
MKTIYRYMYLILMLAAVQVKAQDFHLSQYDQATLYMNPATTGLYAGEKGDYKIYADYRSQWRALGIKPFSTAYLAYDMHVQKWGKSFGFGAYVIDNNGGTGNFNSMNVMLSGAYDILNKAEGKHYLSTGLQLGILYNSFNPNSFSYDNQYSASSGGFDNTISNGESFPNTSIVRLDANLGLYYKFIDKEKKIHPFAGFSIQHVNEPYMSAGALKVRLPMRFNLLAGTDIQTNENLKLSPRILYMKEAGATEFNIGILAYYKIKDPFEIIGGIDYRVKDAIVIHLGLKEGHHTFRFSYDANTSYLNTYSAGKGAWEFSLILTGEKGKPMFSPKSRF